MSLSMILRHWNVCCTTNTKVIAVQKEVITRRLLLKDGKRTKTKKLIENDKGRI